MQLAVETVFLEATLQLVAPESSPLSDGQANAVETLVFDWVLHAEKYVDSKHFELLKARDRVSPMMLHCAEGMALVRVATACMIFAAPIFLLPHLSADCWLWQVTKLCGEIIGAMSSTHLVSISNRFFRVSLFVCAYDGMLQLAIFLFFLEM